MNTSSRSLAGALGLALVVAGLASVGTSSALAAPSSAASTTTASQSSDDLVQTGDTQQRWLSVPGSRIVLNPYDVDRGGSEVSQSSGSDVPLSTGYYAADEALRTTDLLQLFRTSTEASGAPTVVFSDDFSSPAGWSTASVNGNGATLASDGSTGTVTLGSSAGYGAVEKQLDDIDLDVASDLTVKVTATTGKWAIKVYVSGNNDAAEIQHDTDATGTFTYDLAALTGWTGTHSFRLKLYQIGGSGSTTTYDDVSIHSQDSTVASASAYSTTWTTSGLTYDATYADGTVTGVDTFVTDSSVARLVEPRLGSGAFATSGGVLDGTSTYDAASHVITTRFGQATRAVALPATSTVAFYPSLSALRSGATGASTPSGTSGYWAATPADGASYAVGIGFAVGTDAAAGARAAQLATAASTVAAVQAARTSRTASWDDYLARVPVPEDFSIHTVDPVGVTPADVEKAYYQAWVDLEMNVLPATPETGNEFAQLGTGKPSLWMNGTPGTKNVASWDSLLGMQALVYVDPQNAWASFQGMMALVGSDGALGGESLPSRKAQTAWVLYNVTGDRDRLASTYDALSRHLTWESQHLRWILGSHDFADERDSEFVVSLITDLEYAGQIATTLGRTSDVTSWRELRASLLTDYEDWFFPGEGTTLQKVFLDDTQAEDTGTTMYVATGLRIGDLPARYVDELTGRFYRDYSRDRQFAGLAGGASGIKAPDAQLTAYGLLEHGMVEQADVFLASMTRDMVRSGWFSEVYSAASDNLNGTPVASGVRPSLFGIANLIDNVWISNGYRLDGGAPNLVRLPGARGGVSGLTYLGKSLDVSLGTTGVTVSGSAVPGRTCTTTAAPGVSLSLAQVCTPPPPVVTPPASSQLTASSLSTATYPGAARVAVAVSTAATSVSGTVTVRRGATALASTHVSSGAAVIVDVPTAALGASRHVLSVAFTPAAGVAVAPSATTTAVTVAKGHATVKVRASAKKLRVGKRARVTVRIGTVGTAVPGGRVAVRVGSKKVGRAKVVKHGKVYRAVVKTKKLKKKGRITVVYSGDRNLAKQKVKTSKKVRADQKARHGH